MPCARSNNVIGVVLAGGQSTRMGTNKALLPYHNQNLLDHMLQLLKNVGVDSVYVSGQIDSYPCIRDSISNIGPVGGIYSVLRYLDEYVNKFLFVPVDMPGLTVKLLQTLIDQGDHKSIYFENYYLPLLLQHTPKLHQFFNSELKGDPKNIHCSIRHMLQCIGATTLKLDFNMKTSFANINTPNAWMQFIESTND